MAGETDEGSLGPSVVVLHDRFPQMGGGERVAVEMARTLDAPLYTMYVYDDTDVPAGVDVTEIRPGKYTTGVTGRLLKWKSEGMNPLEPAAVGLDMTDAHPELANYDVVITSGPLSKHYVPEPRQAVVNYPHSPPRWLYDQFSDRMEGFDYPVIRTALKGYAQLWRSFDKQANSHIDQFVANSEVCADRIRRYYGRDADVVYPPVKGDWRNEGNRGYYVTWSRLVPEKRVSVIAEAFTGLDERLVIAGDGPQRDVIEALAAENDNIDYRGYVEDIESLVAHASAVVFAAESEDFGMVGAEALAAGKPLIGPDEGYTAHQIVEGKTGTTAEPTIEGIREAIRSFDPKTYDPDVIQYHAEEYSREAFAEGIRRVVAEVTE